MASKGMPTLRILLILSAIDLLCSALTAGLVLFVILVGGNAGNMEAAASAGAGSGLNEIITVDGRGTALLFGPPEINKQANGQATSTPPDANEKPFFNANVFRRIYLVPSRYSRISVIGSSSFEIVLRPIAGPAVHLFVRCAENDRALEFSIAPLSFPDCIARVQAGPIALPNVSTILVPAQNNAFSKLSEQSSSSPFVRRYKVGGSLSIPQDLAIWGIEE